VQIRFETTLVVHKERWKKESNAMQLIKIVLRLKIRKGHKDGPTMIRLTGHLTQKYHPLTSFAMRVRSVKQIEWIFICFGGHIEQISAHEWNGTPSSGRIEPCKGIKGSNRSGPFVHGTAESSLRSAIGAWKSKPFSIVKGKTSATELTDGRHWITSRAWKEALSNCQMLLSRVSPVTLPVSHVLMRISGYFHGMLPSFDDEMRKKYLKARAERFLLNPSNASEP
jgi:hypothetical protein